MNSRAIALIIAVGLILTTGAVGAQSKYDLHDFGGLSGKDGSSPYAGITFDKAGNLYGTASSGGKLGDGMVWEITSSGVYKDLHDFGGTAKDVNGVSHPDGQNPEAGVTFDSTGNLYGTTYYGGQFGGGIVWEITSSGHYIDLHDFGGTLTNSNGTFSDGYFPQASVTFDSTGNMYGTADFGGLNLVSDFNNGGIVWELTTSGQYFDLHDFGGTLTNYFGSFGDGQLPRAAVTFDTAGNMYGTTLQGGFYSSNNEFPGGIVWELTASRQYFDLHDFGGTYTNAVGVSWPDGQFPQAAVTFDSTGNMYGTTTGGGANVESYFGGIVWERTASGQYFDLHDFGGTVPNANGTSGPDGQQPQAAVTFDSSGNMYGTTFFGGPNQNSNGNQVGMVWEISKSASYLDLHDFGGTVTNANGAPGPDGQSPGASVAFDAAGNMYGTTQSGGQFNGGILWEWEVSAAAAPTANPQTVDVPHKTPKVVTLTGSSPDKLPLTFAIVDVPNGSLGPINQATGAVTYTPNDNFHGKDSFTFTVCDGFRTSRPAIITLIIAVGTPTANPQTVSVPHNTAANITLTATDKEDPPLGLTFAIKTSPAHGTLGTLNKSTGAVTYTPDNKFQGKDSFTFTVSNGTNTSAPATVTLDVAPGVPAADAQTVKVTKNTKVTITLTGTDPDNPALPLTFALKSEPPHGKVSGLNSSTGEVTYTPGENFTGKDSFTFTVSNGTNTSTAATVTLTVSSGG